MIVYYVEPDSKVRTRTWHRTRAEAHLEAKKIPALDPVIVQVDVDATHRGIVDMLNGTPTIEHFIAAWTLSPRKGLRPLDLKEL